MRILAIDSSGLVATVAVVEEENKISKTIAEYTINYKKTHSQTLSLIHILRIQGGTNPLDGTSVHPESYEAAGKLLEKQGFKPEDIAGGKLAGLSLTIKDYKKLAEELGIGEITLRDIVKELEKPARDPRDEMPKPILRTDVLDMKDLKAVSYTHLDVYKRQNRFLFRSWLQL